MTEKRNEYPERTVHYKNGGTKFIPAHYEIHYIADDGKEIAWYRSKDDVIYLKTAYISKEFKKAYSERIIGSRYEKEYEKLIKKYSKVSEYMSA